MSRNGPNLPPVALRAARVFTPAGELEDAWVTVDGDRIAGVGHAPPHRAQRVELGEVDLLPGLVDLHSDCLDERMRPRPGSSEPLVGALLQLDAEAITHGVTTHFVCARVGTKPGRWDDAADAVRLVETVERWRPLLRSDTLVHLRMELTAHQLELGTNLVESPAVGLVSYMDHSPGQGQFVNEDQWLHYYAGQLGAGEAELVHIRHRQKALAGEFESLRRYVADAAVAAGIPLASHDDDSPAAVARAVELGAVISEFPINLEGLTAAKEAGLGTVMGAPNARRGGSHVLGLSAREAVAEGTLDALASDYHLPSLLTAPYGLAAAGVCTLDAAVRLVTEGPARIAGLNDRGMIAPGFRADLVAVSLLDGQPVVELAIREGRPVLGVRSPGASVVWRIGGVDHCDGEYGIPMWSRGPTVSLGAQR